MLSWRHQEHSINLCFRVDSSFKITFKKKKTKQTPHIADHLIKLSVLSASETIKLCIYIHVNKFILHIFRAKSVKTLSVVSRCIITVWPDILKDALIHIALPAVTSGLMRYQVRFFIMLLARIY